MKLDTQINEVPINTAQLYLIEAGCFFFVFFSYDGSVLYKSEI